MAANGRGPGGRVPQSVGDAAGTRTDPSVDRYETIPNPDYEKALRKAHDWASHCEAQFMGPFHGDTPEELDESRKACMSVAATSKDMALMWAAVAQITPRTIRMQRIEHGDPQ